MPTNIGDIRDSTLNGLFATNLFSPGSPYDVNDPNYQKIFTFIGQTVIGGSFDFSNTILGRVLGPNTPLQKVGNNQLAKEFAYRIGSSLRNNVLPSIDLNNIFNSDPNKKIFTSANYWDVTKQDRLGFSQIVQILTGFESGKNPFARVGNGFTSSMSNAELLENSGDGTIQTYNKLTSQNKYKPDQIIDNNGNVSTERNLGYINNQDGPLSALDNVNTSPTDTDNFNPLFTSTDKFYYKKGNVVGTRLNDVTGQREPYGILDFTQKIVNNSILDGNFNPSDKGDIIGNNINLDSKSFKSKNLDSRGISIEISKGRNIKDDNGVYKRTWTRSDQYDKYEDAIRHRKLDKSSLSTLKDPGTLKFHPTLDNEGNIDVKGMMFSIENLAYKNSNLILRDYEKGLNGGRLMWFPPYELTITESSRANWDSVNFIGRSEPMYTYNGAERNVNIGFKLIVDHPSTLSNINLTSTEGFNETGNYDKFFAGVLLPSNATKGLTQEQRDQLLVQSIKLQGQTEIKQTSLPNYPYTKSNPLKVYFDNNDSSIKINLVDSGSGNTASNTSLCANTITLANFLSKNDDGKTCVINIVGRTSALGTSSDNETLGLNRANAYRDYLLSFISPTNPSEIDNVNNNNRWNIISEGETNANTGSSLNTVVRDATDRVVDVYLEYSPSLDSKVQPSKETEESKKSKNDALAATNNALRESKNGYKDGGESRYFEQLKKDDPLILDKYSQKIKYFHPIFHSQTPEDLNSRLTFLQQCTRQGKSINSAENSIFGTAPVCILRIGDFFHTQIIIESVQISYEPLLWDLNPEGVGVQPMLCDITLDCKVIGGQSMEGPLQQLQTALSHNFYANTELYRK